MANSTTVKCVVWGFQEHIAPQTIEFGIGKELQLSVEGALGPSGIAPRSADLLDLAAAAFQIERLLRGHGRLNRPTRFELTISMRDKEAWTGKTVEFAEAMLSFLGNARWHIKIHPGASSGLLTFGLAEAGKVGRVALLSGGMDSTCGAATLAAAGDVQLVSFYSTHQKWLQAKIASEIGLTPPIQWRLHWNRDIRQGGTFYYRSFLFLSLAAVVAQSWGVREVYQFENGILATAIPPGPSWMMTKHAHPMLHRLAEELFSSLFGGKWSIRNPFLTLTKRDCCEEAVRAIGQSKTYALLRLTETCWYQWSNRIPGAKKTPGDPCGVCVPCIIRRTAFPEGKYSFDLIRDPKIRQDANLGIAFESYLDLAARIAQAQDEYAFYGLLPCGTEQIEDNSDVTLAQLFRLFQKFGVEFLETYRIRKVLHESV